MPKGLFEIIKEVRDFFRSIKIDYWLGGGLFQRIKEKRFSDIEKNWKNIQSNNKGHDVDFYIMACDIEQLRSKLEVLLKKGYELNGNGWFFNKLAIIKNKQPIDILFLFNSFIDNKVVCLYGYGKKEFWSSVKLPEKIRQRYYCYSLPIESFGNSELEIKNGNNNKIAIRVPEEIYLKVLYPDFKK